jgi:hypothetical protein
MSFPVNMIYQCLHATSRGAAKTYAKGGMCCGEGLKGRGVGVLSR